MSANPTTVSVASQRINIYGPRVRKPSNRKKLYAWWQRAVRAQAQYTSLKEAAAAGMPVPEIVLDEPQCGFYKRRLVRNGPWVPARIYMVQRIDRDGELVEPERLVCEIGGRKYDAAEAWPWLADHPILEKEFRFGIGHRAWRVDTIGKRENATIEHTAVDLRTVAPPTFKRKKPSGKRNQEAARGRRA